MLGCVVVYATFCNALSLYRNGQNNANARHYRNKTACVVCIKRGLLVSIFRYSFFFSFKLCSARVNVLQMMFNNCARK